MNQEELAKKLLSPLKELSSREIREKSNFCLPLFDCYHCGYDFNLCSPKRFVNLLCQWS